MSNSAVISFHRHEYGIAAELYEKAFQLAQESQTWPILVGASSGRALCSARQGHSADLARWVAIAHEQVKGNVQDIFDRSFFEMAVAWHSYLGGADVEMVVASLKRVASRLRRRDIEDWLLVELEALKITEHASGRRDERARARIRELARPYKLGIIEREAS
jgi:hypothetical protein